MSYCEWIVPNHILISLFSLNSDHNIGRTLYCDSANCPEDGDTEATVFQSQEFRKKLIRYLGALPLMREP